VTSTTSPSAGEVDLPGGGNRSKLVVVAERAQFLPGWPGSNGNSTKVAETTGVAASASGEEEGPS
jgi:hypothetical protein